MYGTIVYDGRLTTEIYSLTLEDGALILRAVCYSAKRKDIPRPDEGLIPWAIYGSDGALIAVSKTDAATFRAAYEYWATEIWVEQRLEIDSMMLAR